MFLLYVEKLSQQSGFEINYYFKPNFSMYAIKSFYAIYKQALQKKIIGGCCVMSRSKKPVNPAAQKALDQLKEETAAEIGLKDYKNTYKGALSSADNGRVGGQMVRKMIQAQEQQFSGK